jgi:hypothetical protein
MNYCLPKNYIVRHNPTHHIDIGFKDEGQKEVYIFAQRFAIKNGYRKIVDIGCGSAYKLINYFGDMDTVGYEVEPTLSYLKNEYPNKLWKSSGENADIRMENFYESCDVIICSDVIEHIKNPDTLIEFLLKFDAKYYIISTPCREVLCNNAKFNNYYASSYYGPPINSAHALEWTMIEFIEYLSTYFIIVESHYGIDQIECQYHLLKRR